MTTTTEGYIHIRAAGLDSQTVNALKKKHWYVVCRCRDNHFLFLLIGS
jgi:hypothetical protein